MSKFIAESGKRLLGHVKTTKQNGDIDEITKALKYNFVGNFGSIEGQILNMKSKQKKLGLSHGHTSYAFS